MPKMPTSGGLMTGVKNVIPYPPRLETVNVLPMTSAGDQSPGPDHRDHALSVRGQGLDGLGGGVLDDADHDPLIQRDAQPYVDVRLKLDHSVNEVGVQPGMLEEG